MKSPQRYLAFALFFGVRRTDRAHKQTWWGDKVCCCCFWTTNMFFRSVHQQLRAIWDTNQVPPPRLSSSSLVRFWSWPGCPSPTDSLTILTENVSGKVFSNTFFFVNTFLQTTPFLVKTDTKVFVSCCLATNLPKTLRGLHLSYPAKYQRFRFDSPETRSFKNMNTEWE